MNCPTCQADQEPSRRYCGQCGNTLIQPCRRCVFVNSVHDRFCGGCGESLGGTHSQAVVPEQKALPQKALPKNGFLRAEELDLLIRAPAPASSCADELPAHVSQKDLDQLFSGES
ncbi:MAG: double zinc ribbon domain-containing protein [Myxococcota bacterium]